MIIKSKHHWFYYTWFKIYYAKWKIHQYFHKVHFVGDFTDRNLPILIICNHVSWWDGIWVMYLNTQRFNRKFHFMMLEDQIKENIICNYVGGYSVKKKSRSIIESLNYTSELLSDINNLVLLFPQGKIESLYMPYINFEDGFDKVLKKINSEVQTIFIANLVDYFSDTKPSLYMYFQEYSGLHSEIEKIQEDFNHFYSACISKNLSKSEF